MMCPLVRIVTSALCLLLLASDGVEGFAPKTRAHRGKASSLVRRAETAEAPATTTDSSAPSLAELPPVIQQIADDRRVYQMQLGKAMDTLRRDMQDILTEKPDYSIYAENISVVDPSGAQLKGLDKYQSAIAFFQTFLSFWFRPKASGLQFRMVYDFCRSSIRISWHAVLVPKMGIFGKPLCVDGISYYQLDRSTGMIDEHRIEKLMINNSPVIPPYGILSILQQDALRLRGAQGGVPVGVPSYLR